MGILLSLGAIILLILAIKLWRDKLKWVFRILFVIILAVTAWYFVPFQIDLTNAVDAGSVVVRYSDRSIKEVEITDAKLKADVLTALDGAIYQRRAFLGNFFAERYEAKDTIRLLVTDDSGYFSEYVLNVAHNVSFITVWNGRMNIMLRILNPDELIGALDKLHNVS